MPDYDYWRERQETATVSVDGTLFADDPDEDIPASTVEALETANHWVPQDRTDACVDELRAFPDAG